MENFSNDRFLSARAVLARYGVSEMTIYRWLRNDKMEFPRPTYFGRNRYWKLIELQSWESARASKPSSAA